MRMIGSLIAIVISFAAGAIGSLATMSSIPTWYAALNKPPFNPPNWLFGPAWTILYIMMGISSYLIWEKGWEKPEVKIALALFAIQLILNSSWSVLFFGTHSLIRGFVCIVFLWFAILLTMIKFFALSSTAGWLLVPYILWVSFASILNYFIMVLNK